MTRLPLAKVRRLAPDQVAGLKGERLIRSQPTVVDGIRFASKREARRYQDLRLLERAGEIEGLRTHPAWPLTVYGSVVGTYTADFAYLDRAGELVVEDVKPAGFRTREYKRTRRLMKAIYDIEIVEIE